MVNELDNYISRLDTQRFGFKIARIDDFQGNSSSLCKEMQERDVKLIISRINSSELQTINNLEDLGFRIKDIQLKYRYDLHRLDFDYSRLPKDFIIREAVPGDIPQLSAIAEEAFRDYGHYSADQLLDKEKCLEIYKDWTRRSFFDKNVADKFFLAEKGNIIMGFLSFKIFAEEGAKYLVSVIGAVSEKFRGKDVFPSLLRLGILWGAGLNLKWVEHKVLAANSSANRSLDKVGFRVVDSFITMHCWFDRQPERKGKNVLL